MGNQDRLRPTTLVRSQRGGSSSAPQEVVIEEQVVQDIVGEEVAVNEQQFVAATDGVGFPGGSSYMSLLTSNNDHVARHF